MNIKIATWNVRGLTNTSKQDEVKLLISENNLNMCAIIETRLIKKMVKPVCENIFGNWSWATNSTECNKGCRIAVGWESEFVEATLLSSIGQVMHFEVKIFNDKRKFFVSFIYGDNDAKDRFKLWDSLIDHMAVTSSKPWVILGDFNVIMYANEHSNGVVDNNHGVKEFRKCMESLDMEDLVMNGFFFTWIQKRKDPESGILKKLDRVMGNSDFLDQFGASFASFLPYVTSDHCPALLCIPDWIGKKRRSFRFMNFLAEKKEFHQTVKENWNEPITGYAMFVLAKRLKNMKKHIRELNRKNGNVFVKVKVLREELKKVQAELDKDPKNGKLREEEIVFNNAYKDAVLDEERVLKQKAKVEWLREGDQNSAYFHNLLKGRMSKSRIVSVKDDMGREYTDEDIASVFVSHFQEFLGNCEDVFPIDEPDVLFNKCLDTENALHLIKEVSDEEIKIALFDIDDGKAPGPDGFTSKFFKASWDIVGYDVCLAVREFFNSGKMLGELNTTLISLVPKCINPTNVTDYRPIAYCNVVYKCISKVITNRIKVVLKDLVDANQSAFIEGRHISDNIMLAQELMCGYVSRKKVGRCTFKVDLQKAYDTVSWEFLEFCLLKFGFHKIMVNWIMVCLKSASFSICVNGESHGFFKAKRGLRQGDPISPYLFTLVMEVLTLMIKRQVSMEEKFKYHWGCKKLKITSLCFADDLMLFCHGDKVSASVIRRALDEFCLSSGLRPNMNKSTIYFGNVTEVVKQKIKLVMPFNEGILPVKYLGIPLDSNRIARSDCTMLLESVKRRIDCWQNKQLSFAGRLQLIASVLSSLNVYWASIFILPKGICDDIDKMLKRFLWHTNEGKSFKFSVSWKEVCMQKSEGGLGLKSLHIWNEALMAKHLWNVISNKDSLWVKWVNGQWLKGDSIWVSKPNQDNSWSWRQILSLRDKVRNFVIHKIGNGKKCFFWFDKWHERGPMCNLINYASLVHSSMDMKIKVADLVNNGAWNWPCSWNSRFGEILDIQVPNIIENFDDKVVWENKKGKKKNFSVNEVWKVMKDNYPKVIWVNHVWFTQCVPRHSFILWMAVKGRLKTQDRISRWLNIQDMSCPFCNGCKDSHSHLFFSCNFARRLWERLKIMAKLDNVSNSWAQIISCIVNRPAKNTIWSVIQRLVLGASVYFIWQERNMRLFDGHSRTMDELFKIVVENVRFRIMGLKLKVTPDVITAANIWNFPIDRIYRYKCMLDELMADNLGISDDNRLPI